MRKIYLALLAICFAAAVNGQITVTNPGNTTPGLAATYTDLASAIAALNTQTAISGPVTIAVDPGNPQTAPNGGYTINATLTGASSTNTVTFEGNSNTITASAALTAGVLHDAIFEIIGSDYITIQNFIMNENAANTTTASATNNMTEWGVALLYASATNGCQNITIRNNTIDLNRTYNNTFGIYSNSTHTSTAVTTTASATGATGGNHNLVITGNSITDVNQGIVIVGPTAAADQNTGVVIGGSVSDANTLTNYGTSAQQTTYANVSGTMNGILIRNSNGFTISHNSVTSSAGGVTTGTLRGIINVAASNAPTNTFTNIVSNNTVSVQGGAAGTTIAGIILESTNASVTSTLNFNNNNITNLNHTVAATTSVTALSNASPHLTTNINNNTFTNLTSNTTGSFTFISNNVSRPASAVCNVNNNSIVTAFNKTGAGGTITFYNSNSTTPATASETNTGNNFSNITVTGATTIAGWISTDGSTSSPFGPSRTVTNNTFTSITGGTNAVTVLLVSFSNNGSTTNNVSGNTITNITGGGAVTGLTTTGGKQNFFSNTINTLSTSGASTVTGFSSTSGTAAAQEIYKNKIYGLSGSNAGSTVNGILISGSSSGQTLNIYNNLIGDLTAPAATGTDAVRGISSTSTGTTSTFNVYYNTVYLTGGGGTNFGSSGIFHTTSTTATTAALNMRNNIIVNNTTPNGTGLAVAYRRSAGAAGNLANYASTSNNNLFYAGTPSATNLIYSDGTSTAQTLTAYKNGVFTAGTIAPRDAGSVTENPPFLSTTGASANFLHIDPTIATQVESGAVSIGGVTDDYDGDTRNATTPDIGADEFAGIAADLSAPNISYTPLGNTCTLTGVTLTATITDASGVPTAGIGLPVLYWRINAGAYSAATGTFIGSNQYQFTFGSGVVLGDIVSYYIVAQDNAGTPNVGASPSGGAGGFTANPPAAATPPTTPSSFTIQANLNGTYPVGVGQSGFGGYETITAAVAAYNTSCLSGPVIFSLTDATYPTETYPITINPNSYASATNTLTIKPATGVTPTISGTLASDFLFRVYSNYVIFDGSNVVSGTSRDMTITNASATSPSAVLYGSVSPNPNVGGTIKNVIFINGATNTSNVVVGSSTSTTGSGVAGLSNNFTFQNNSSRNTNFGLFVIQTTAAGNGSGMLITGNDFTIGLANAGISVQGVDGITISNNTISGINQATSEIDYGIRLRTGTINATVSNNTISNLGYSLTASTGNAYGIWVESANAASNVNVTGNTITDFTSSGAATTVGTTGIYVSGATAGVTIQNNIIRNMKNTNTGGFGASGMQLSSSSTTANIVVKNNMISDIAGYGKATAGVADNGYGIVISNGAGYGIYYNSIHLNTDQTLVGGLPAAINITSGVSTAGAIDLRNNIFTNSQAVGTERYAIYSGAANTVFSNIDYNDYFTTGPNLGFIGSNRATLADIQTGFGGNTNSENVQPSFISATDLHLTAGGNAALDAGATPIGGITVDIDGNTRDVTTPDIGADEFTALAGVDMGATALVAPAASGCYTATETVTVTIRNYSASMIDFAVNNVTVTVTATGGYNQNVVLNSGTLAAGATQNVSMPATINMSVNGTYTFNANTSVAGDITPGNDAMTPVNRIALNLNGTYTVGTGGNYANLTAAVADYNTASCITGPIVFELISTYTSVGETFPITINANAFAGTNTLTIRPASGQNPLITGSVGAGSILKLNGADYIIIDGSNNGSNSRNLTIQNTTATTSGNAVIWLASPAVGNGATNNIVKNCVIEGNSSTTTFTGIHVGGNATIGLTTAGTELNSNNTINNNLFRKTQYGATLFGFGTATPDQNNTISNNNFGTAVTGEGFSLLAINADRQQNLVVSGNEVQNVVNATNTSSTPFGGIRLLDFKDGLCYNNRVHDLAYTGTSTPKIYGIAITSATYTTVGNPSNALVYNNVVYRITSTGTSAVWNMTGILASAGYGDRFYYNSVHLTGQLANSSSGLAAAFANGDGNITTVCTNIDVRNNSFSITGSSAIAGGNFWAHYTAATTLAGSTLNNNDLYCAGTNVTNNVGRFNAANSTTLAAWQGATGQEANSISADPLYNSTSNLVPQLGSPLVAAGTPIAGITTDILGTTRNVTTPTIGAYETAADAIPPVISYTLIPVNCTTGDRLLNGVTITDASGVPTAGALQPKVYFRKNTDPWFSSQGTLASGTGTNGTWDFTISAATMGGLAGGDVISYYVIAQDIAAIPNIGSNPSAGLVASDVNTVTTHPTTPNTNTVGLTLSGTYSVGTGQTFNSLSSAIDAYNNGCLSGPVIFQLTDASYSSGEAFPIGILNNVTASATNTLTIRPTLPSTTISGASVLSILYMSGARYVTIDGRIGSTGSTRDLTITNTTTTAPAVLFNNDANNDAVRYAILRSDNTTGGVVNLLGTSGTAGNDDITIDNCNIGPNAGTPQFGIHSLGQSLTADNSSITVTNNNIFDFFSAGSASAGINVNTFSSGWTITGNNFYQTATRTTTASNQHSGIFISNSGTGYTISNNSIGGSTTGAGGTAWTIAGAFTNRFVGISVNANAAATTSIQGNTIANFVTNTTSSASTANGNFSGIWVSGGSANIGTTTGNTIGSTTGNGSITVNLQTNSGGTANLIAYSGAGTVDIRNNNIGSVNLTASTLISQGCQAIFISGGSPTVIGNTIGSTSTANSIHSSTVSTSATAQQMNGIIMTSGVSTASDININNNTVANITQAGTGTSHYIRGISFQGQGSTATILLNIQNNSIFNLSGANANATLASVGLGVMGIQVLNNTGSGFYTNPVITGNTINSLFATNTGALSTNVAAIGASNCATGTISKNRIYDLRNASTGTTATAPPTATGILVRAVVIGNLTSSNNMISLGNGQTTNTQFMGIWHGFSSSNANLYFNTVNIEGSVGAGALPSFGFMRGDNTAASAIASATDVRNNIFNNTRSGGTGNHYAIGNNYGNAASTATGWAAGASNYNALNSASASTIGYWNTAQNFAGWKSASSCDANSISGYPATFVNTATGDLHLNMGVTSTPMESGAITGTGIVVDYDNDARPGPAGSINGGATSPDMGADEFDGVPLDLFAPTITYNLLLNSTCTSNRPFAANVIDNGGVNTTAGTRPRIYYKRSIDGNAWNDNTNSTDGWKFAEASNTSSPFNFTIDYSLLNGGTGVAAGTTIQYFVVAQDLALTPNVAIYNGSFAATPSSVALTAAAFPIGGTISSYDINTGLNTTLTVGAAGDYTSLTGASGLFNAINTNGLIGNTTVNILDASVTETGAVALNQIQSGGCSATSYSLLIKPNSGVTSTLTGSINNSGLIRIFSNNVTIDGSNNGTTSRDLTVTNTSTTGPTTILIASTGTTPVTNVTLKNSIVINGTQSNSAVVISDPAGNAGYFNNITVQNNSIQQAYIGVFAIAVPAAGNGSGTLITRNDLNTAGANSIRLVGVYAQGIDGATISNNTIGNIANTVDANNISGIWLASGTVNTTVISNTISGISSSVGATVVNPRGIAVSSGSATSGITISGNTISNISLGTAASGSAAGIQVFTATGGVIVQRNTISNIKSLNTAGWGANGIHLASTLTAANIDVVNNVIYDVAGQGFNGIGFDDNGTGIMVNSGGGYNIRFNSINMATDQVSAAGRTAAINIAAAVTTAASLDIRNNVFVNTQTIGNRYAIISAASNTVFSSINYNDYFSAGSVGYNGTTDYANLAAWQGASGQDANSISADPLFTSATNLNPQASSPVISAGVYIGSVTNDIVMAGRNSVPSMGAFENKIAVSARIFLNGAYNAGLTRHKDVSATWAAVLNANALSQPYNIAAFGNYAGTESVTAGFFTSTGATTDIVDWVLVELRDAATPSTVISRRAAFVREDGRIVDLDGTSAVGFRGFTPANYYFVIRHRNHLGIRTAAAQLVDGLGPSALPYDFSTAQAQAYQDPAILALAPPNNNPAMRDVSGVFVMWGGNGNSNNTTRASGPLAQNDYGFLITTTLGGDATLIIPNVYSRADYNMDGTVRASGPLALNDYGFLITTTLGGDATRIVTQHQ